MPDNQPDPNTPNINDAISLLTKIAIRLEQSVENQGVIIKEMVDTSRSATKTQKAIDNYDDSIKTLNKTKQQLFLTMQNLRKAFSSTFNAAVAGAATAAGVLYKSVMQTGESLRTFQISSRNATYAIADLTKGYLAIGKAGQASVVSLQQLAQEISKFQSKGLATRLLAAGQGFQQGFRGMLEILTRTLGSENASQLMDQFFGAFDERYGTLTNVMRGRFSQLSKQIQETIALFEQGGPGAGAAKDKLSQDIPEIIDLLHQFEALAPNDAIAGQIRNVANAYGAQLQQIQSQTPGAIAAFTSFTTVIEKVRQSFQEAQRVILDKFGGPLAQQVEKVRLFIQNRLGAWLENEFPRIWDRLRASAENAWLTIKKSIDFVRPGLEVVLSVIKRLWSAFESSPPWLQALATAILVVPGLKQAIGGVITGIVSVIAQTIQWSKVLQSLKCPVSIDDCLNPKSMIQSFGAAIKSIAMTATRVLAPVGAGIVTAMTGAWVGESIASLAGLSQQAQKTAGVIGGIASGVAATAAAFALFNPATGVLVGIGAAGYLAYKTLSEQSSTAAKELDRVKNTIDETQQKIASLHKQLEKGDSISVTLKLNVELEQEKLKAIEQQLRQKQLESWWYVHVGLDWFVDDSELKRQIEQQQQIAEAASKLQSDMRAKWSAEDVQHINELTKKAQELSDAITRASSEDSTAMQSRLLALGKALEAQRDIANIKVQVADLEGARNAEKDLDRRLVLTRQLEDAQNRLVEKQKIAPIYEAQGNAEEAIRQLQQIRGNYEELQQAARDLSVAQEKAGKPDTSGNVRLTRQMDELNDRYNRAREALEKMADADPRIKVLITTIDSLKRGTADLAETAKSAADFTGNLAVELKKLQEQNLNIQNLTTNAESFAAILEQFGWNAEFAGVKITDMVEQAGQQALQQLPRAIQSANESMSALQKKQVDVAKRASEIRQQLEITPDETKRLELTKELESLQAGLLQQQQMTNAEIAKTGRIFETLISSRTAVQEQQKKYNQLTIDLLESQLQISQNLYGTPALAVEAQLQIVDALQKQVALTQQEIVNVDTLIAQLSEQPGHEADIYALQKKRLQLQNEVAQVQSKQLSQLRQLRDGYLEAVQAQAFGAGKFEKIIVTQEKNLGIALEKGIAKTNFLLGQVDSAARASDRTPYRYSAEGTGILQDMAGQEIDRAALRKYAAEAIKNIADPRQRSAAEQALGQVEAGYDRFTQIQVDHMKSTDDNTQAINGMTGAIHALIGDRRGMFGAGAIKGSVNEGIVSGEAARKAMPQTPGQSSVTGVIPTTTTIVQQNIDKASKPLTIHEKKLAQYQGKQVARAQQKVEKTLLRDTPQQVSLVDPQVATANKALDKTQDDLKTARRQVLQAQERAQSIGVITAPKEGGVDNTQIKTQFKELVVKNLIDPKTATAFEKNVAEFEEHWLNANKHLENLVKAGITSGPNWEAAQNEIQKSQDQLRAIEKERASLIRQAQQNSRDEVIAAHKKLQDAQEKFKKAQEQKEDAEATARKYVNVRPSQDRIATAISQSAGDKATEAIKNYLEKKDELQKTQDRVKIAKNKVQGATSDYEAIQKVLVNIRREESDTQYLGRIGRQPSRGEDTETRIQRFKILNRQRQHSPKNLFNQLQESSKALQQLRLSFEQKQSDGTALAREEIRFKSLQKELNYKQGRLSLDDLNKELNTSAANMMVDDSDLRKAQQSAQDAQKQAVAALNAAHYVSQQQGNTLELRNLPDEITHALTSAAESVVTPVSEGSSDFKELLTKIGDFPGKRELLRSIQLLTGKEERTKVRSVEPTKIDPRITTRKEENLPLSHTPESSLPPPVNNTEQTKRMSEAMTKPVQSVPITKVEPEKEQLPALPKHNTPGVEDNLKKLTDAVNRPVLKTQDFPKISQKQSKLLEPPQEKGIASIQTQQGAANIKMGDTIQGFTTKDTKPIAGSKEERQMEKIRAENAKQTRKKQRHASLSDFDATLRKGLQAHREAENSKWNEYQKQMMKKKPDQPTLDTVAYKEEDQSFTPETKTGRVLQHGGRRRNRGIGGETTQIVTKATDALMEAADHLNKLGDIVDDIDNQDPKLYTRPRGNQGHFIPG